MNIQKTKQEPDLTYFYNIFAPESIDSTKIISFFNDKLEAILNDVIDNIDWGKKYINLNEKMDLLNSLNIFTFPKDNIIKYNISSNISVFSLINIPINWKIEDLKIKFNSLSKFENKIERIYKKTLFWNIVSFDETFVFEFEKELNFQKFSEMCNEKIKFDKLTYKEIYSNLQKQINQSNYLKDSDILLKNISLDNHSSNKLSWRKKSTDTNEDLKFLKNNNKISTNFQRSIGMMRDRYNTDGYQTSFKTKFPKRKEEIEIDLSKIHYSLKIKNKYSNADILLLYDKFRINKLFDFPPKFINFIDEICSKEKRKEFNFLKRERSLTLSMPISYRNNKYDEIKLNLDAPAFKLPNQNPLSFGKLNDTINK